MEQAPICGIHHIEMTWKNPGVSKKTGKPYNGFWACALKMPDGSFCQFKPEKTPAPATPTQTFSQGLDKNVTDDKKNAQIAWLNAKNNACILIAATMTEASALISEDAIAKNVQVLASKLYYLKPIPQTAAPATVQAAMAAEENIADIPF